VTIFTSKTRGEIRLVTKEMQRLAELQAEIYRVFSNTKRILIFWSLIETEMSVNEIAVLIDSSIQNTSQHLRLMKAENILDTRRSGQTIYYSVANNHIGNYCRIILQGNLSEFQSRESHIST
jgi:DNA-binding transcriptional ArsR family regulator